MPRSKQSRIRRASAGRESLVPRLPAVGIASRRLLERYTGPLLDKLKAERPSEPSVTAIERARLGLRDALHARELAERLCTRADELVQRAEEEVERGLRAIYADVGVGGRSEVFPAGLGAALEPRHEAQVTAASSVAAVLAERGWTHERIEQLRRSCATLAERLADVHSAHAGLIAAVVGERNRERELRDACTRAFGALSAALPERPRAVQRFFRTPRVADRSFSALPPAPPPTRAKKARKR